jgi:hypothetical protein
MLNIVVLFGMYIVFIYFTFRSLSAMLGKAKGLVWYILYAFGVPLLISALTLWAQISQNRPKWIIWPHIHHDTCWFGCNINELS